MRISCRYIHTTKITVVTNSNNNNLFLSDCQISFTGIEAKTSEGCPTAEWIIRRPSKEELFLGLYRRHKGHHCSKIYTVV